MMFELGQETLDVINYALVYQTTTVLLIDLLGKTIDGEVDLADTTVLQQHRGHGIIEEIAVGVYMNVSFRYISVDIIKGLFNVGAGQWFAVDKGVEFGYPLPPAFVDYLCEQFPRHVYGTTGYLLVWAEDTVGRTPQGSLYQNTSGEI
jgi:hypothetical protein